MPLTPAAIPFINDAIAQTRAKHRSKLRIIGPDDYILSGARSLSLSRKHLDEVFDIISEQIGIKVCPHKVRHAFSTFSFSMPNVNPKDIMNMRGHKNIDMSMYYNLGSAEGMEKVANTFNDKLLVEK